MSEKPEKDNSDENLPAVSGEGGEGSAESASGNKKKKIIMIAAPLILLLGGGAGLYFTGMLDKLLGKEHPAVEASAEGAGAEGEKKEAGAEGGHGEKAAEGEAKKEGEGGGEGAGHAGPAFLKVPDLIVNLNGDGGQTRYLRLSVQLELANEADVKAVEAVLPRVIDQFQTYLRELRIQDLRGSKGMYRLQMEMLSRVNAAAAPTEVKDVLFQEILVQ